MEVSISRVSRYLFVEKQTNLQQKTSYRRGQETTTIVNTNLRWWPPGRKNKNVFKELSRFKSLRRKSYSTYLLGCTTKMDLTN